MGLFKKNKEKARDFAKEYSDYVDKMTEERSKPKEEEKIEIKPVGYYGENDPFGRTKEWFMSEQGQKALAYYRAQFELPLYGRQLKDLVNDNLGCLENSLKCISARDKWPLAYYHYYLIAVNPAFGTTSFADLAFLVSCILMEKEDAADAILYFVEHFNRKAEEALNAISQRPYAFVQLMSYITNGVDAGVDTYKERWLYDDNTYFDKSSGRPFSQNQILYAATLLAEHQDLLPDLSQFVDGLSHFEKTDVANNLM